MLEMFGLIAVAFVFVAFLRSIRIVNQYEKGVVERLGRYHRTTPPGIQFLMPFLDSMRKVDMREKVIDVPPQEVITEDNVVVTVDAVVYYTVTDPVRVLYQVQDFQLATIKLAQTNLRNVIGDMELDETLTSRERINAELRQILDDATDNWGVRITRVEIQKIDPPRDITDAMSQQMKAERERRAAILEAEGVKQSAILRAEGFALALSKIFEVAKDIDAKTMSLQYLETLKQVGASPSTKFVIPAEFTSMLQGLLGATGGSFGDGGREGGRPR